MAGEAARLPPSKGFSNFLFLPTKEKKKVRRQRKYLISHLTKSRIKTGFFKDLFPENIYLFPFFLFQVTAVQLDQSRETAGYLQCWEEPLGFLYPQFFLQKTKKNPGVETKSIRLGLL